MPRGKQPNSKAFCPPRRGLGAIHSLVISCALSALCALNRPKSRRRPDLPEKPGCLPAGWGEIVREKRGKSPFGPCGGVPVYINPTHFDFGQEQLDIYFSLAGTAAGNKNCN